MHGYMYYVHVQVTPGLGACAIYEHVMMGKLPCNPSLVPRPHHARARKGSGDIGADSWFCKLSNHVIICIGFLLEHVRSRDGAQDQENAPMSPDPFPRERLGSGNETIVIHTARTVSRLSTENIRI